MLISPEVLHECSGGLKRKDPTECMDLWVHVLLDAVKDLQTGGSRDSRQFVFDEDNFFFDAVALYLGFTPGGLRDAIRNNLQKGKL